MAEKAGRQDQEVAGYIVITVSRREVTVGTRLTPSLIFSLEPQLTESG